MTTRHSVVIEIPAGPDAALAALRDPALHERTAAAAGIHRIETVSDEDATGRLIISVRRLVPTDEIPAQARAFVGSNLELRQIDAWNAPSQPGGDRDATVVVEVTGAPVKAAGTAQLTAHGSDASVLSYELDITCSLPFIGKSVETAAGDVLRAAAEVQQATLATWFD